jgi:hypothetical protein
MKGAKITTGNQASKKNEIVRNTSEFTRSKNDPHPHLFKDH